MQEILVFALFCSPISGKLLKHFQLRQNFFHTPLEVNGSVIQSWGSHVSWQLPLSLHCSNSMQETNASFTGQQHITFSSLLCSYFTWVEISSGGTPTRTRSYERHILRYTQSPYTNQSVRGFSQLRVGIFTPHSQINKIPHAKAS